jgi:hypothetical protein
MATARIKAIDFFMIDFSLFVKKLFFKKLTRGIIQKSVEKGNGQA